MKQFFSYFLIFASLLLFCLLVFFEIDYRYKNKDGARLSSFVDAVQSFSISTTSFNSQTAFSPEIQKDTLYKEIVSPVPSEVLDVVFPQTITLGFVGDIMLDRGVRQSVERHGGEYDYLFKKISFPDSLDILFGNLEGPASFRGTEVGNMYSFKMYPEALNSLREVGFDVLSLANNHIGDWGKTAADETQQNVLATAILAPGWGILSLEDALAVIKDSGVRVGYLAFSDVGPVWLSASKEKSGVYLATEENLKSFIPFAKEQVDILVVSYHFGDEYSTISNPRQNYLARTAIDLGADIVVGHHPHVVQEIEIYKNGLIAYSLGNFIFDQYFSTETMTGLAVLVEVDKDGVHSYTKGKVSLNNTFQIETLSWEEKILLKND